MSTTIHSSLFKTPLTITPYLDAVEFVIGSSGASYNRSDFVAAVEKELNGIFIDSPKVPLDSGDVDVLTMTDESHVTADEAEMLAAHYANLAAEKRKVPPVDEQQVEALAPLLWEHTQTSSGPGDSWDEITDAERNRFKNRAGRLIATGKVTVSD